MPKLIDVAIFSVDYADIPFSEATGQSARTMPDGITGVCYEAWVYPVHRVNGNSQSLRIFLDDKLRTGKKSCPVTPDDEPLVFVEDVSETEKMEQLESQLLGGEENPQNEEYSEFEESIYYLELFLRDTKGDQIRNKFNTAILKKEEDKALKILLETGYPEEKATKAVLAVIEKPRIYFEKNSRPPPIKSVKMDQDKAREILSAKKELDDRMARPGRVTEHSRGLPGDRNKPNSGKRRTLQFNPWRKKT